MKDRAGRRRASRGHPLAFALPVLAIFVLYYLVRPPQPELGTASESRVAEIHITAELVGEIAAEREAVIGRRATDEEIDALIRTYVDEEVLLREAAARGIDCSGCNGRRHLISRILFVLDGPRSVPTEEDLSGFFSEHQSEYGVPERVSFEHVFFSGKPSDEELERALASLNDGGDRKEIGERFWMGNEIAEITQEEVRAVMGDGFAKVLFEEAGDSWSGPHPSSRGQHFVRLKKRHAPRLPELDDVRIRVEQDWERWQLTTVRERLLTELRDSYVVRVDEFDKANL